MYYLCYALGCTTNTTRVQTDSNRSLSKLQKVVGQWLVLHDATLRRWVNSGRPYPLRG